jgi:hypothetical protein
MALVEMISGSVENLLDVDQIWSIDVALFLPTDADRIGVCSESV